MSENQIKVIGDGRHARLVSRGRWEWVERKNITGIVAILAITHDGAIIMTEQFRPPLGKRVIELPAGLAGDLPGQEAEELTAAAKRELLEETGYQAQEMQYLTSGPASPGLSSEIIQFFLAKALQKIGPGGGDKRENITVHKVPLNQAHQWLEEVASNGSVLVDPKVYTGLYFAARQKKKV